MRFSSFREEVLKFEGGSARIKKWRTSSELVRLPGEQQLERSTNLRGRHLRGAHLSPLARLSLRLKLF